MDGDGGKRWMETVGERWMGMRKGNKVVYFFVSGLWENRQAKEGRIKGEGKKGPSYDLSIFFGGKRQAKNRQAEAGQIKKGSGGTESLAWFFFWIGKRKAKCRILLKIIVRAQQDKKFICICQKKVVSLPSRILNQLDYPCAERWARHAPFFWKRCSELRHFLVNVNWRCQNILFWHFLYYMFVYFPKNQ